MRRKTWIALALIAIVALVASACSSDDDARPGTARAVDGTTSTPADTDTDTDSDGTDADTGSDDTDSGTDTADDGTDSGTDQGDDGSFVWTVVGVEPNDVLNVRSEPNASAPIVTELDPWTTDLETTGQVGGTSSRWRELTLDDGSTGWVNARFLVAQPADWSSGDEAELRARAERFVDWVRMGDDPQPAAFVASGIWAGGIGIYADAGSEWNWISAADLATTADWDEARDFVVGQGIECGSECVLSTRDFLNLDRIDDTTQILIDDIPNQNDAFLDGRLWQAPRSMHRVVIDTPSSDPDQFFDWQRLHLVPDWSSGDITFKVLHNHGWTP